jgi:hypothetical protein
MRTFEIELRRTSYIVLTIEAENAEKACAKAWDEVNDRLDSDDASWDVELIEEVTNQGESK